MINWVLVVQVALIALASAFGWGIPVFWVLPVLRRASPASRRAARHPAAAMVAFYGLFGAWNIWQREWAWLVHDSVGGVIWGYLWWVAGGGDQWRKFRRRVSAAVRQVGARLAVVTPAPGGA